ncbi:hypothetical protein [Streptomyces sp. NPDC059863]|uniref:hypothetical protein n=1 Tax=unclassified Streptomyces TaxID=2593676 RepID=UPI003647DABE
MLAAGVDIRIVSETLGHSESRITRDIYQSVLPKAAREAAEATAAVVPRGGTRRPEPTPPEETAEPRVEQVAQLALDHLVAQIVEAAERDGGSVEDLAQMALAQLSGSTEAAHEHDGHAAGTQGTAKIIEFRPRRVPT